MLNPPPKRLHRTCLRIEGLAVAYAHAGRRWPLKRTRLVLVHGSGCSADSWRYQVLGLSRECEVVAVDLPGHGASEQVADQSIEHYAATVSGVLHRLGRRKVILAGHSMGGAVALHVALEHPRLLKGLVLVATAAHLDALALTPDMLLWALAAMPGKFKGMFFGDLVTDEALAIAWDDVRRCSVETVMGDFAASRRFDFRGRLAQLDVPTLVLCGRDDLITPVRYSRRLQKEIPGATLVLIEKAGHMLPLESPEEVNAAIRRFIREQ